MARDDVPTEGIESAAALNHGLSLSAVERIGFLGDTHGNIGHLLNAARILRSRDVRVFVVLGDWSFIWPLTNWRRDLLKINRRLMDLGITMLFCDGNHEWFPELYKFPIAEDGIRWIEPRIGHLPRGYRTTLSSGRSLAVLGGAHSIDFQTRAIGRTWWPAESITGTDLDALGDDRADVMIGHDAPLNVPAIDRLTAETDHFWSDMARFYSTMGRRVFHRGFLQVEPSLYLGGHFHTFVDEVVEYTAADGHTFGTRVVILDADGGRIADCAAILDVATLCLEFPRGTRPIDTEL